MSERDIEKIYLYRMTHIGNIPHILENGIVHRSSSKANPTYIAIGDQSLIQHRETKLVSINGKTIKLGDYIPFYFGVRMPMLYIIENGFNSVPPVHPSSVIYLAVKVSSIISNPDFEYYFTNGHATNALTLFYDLHSINDLPQIIDWKAITSKQWGKDMEDTDLKRRKEAEFLIKGDIRPQLIAGFVCYDAKAKQQLIKMGVDENKIKIHPNSYYEL